MTSAYAHLRQAERKQWLHDWLWKCVAMFPCSGELMVWGLNECRPIEIQAVPETDWRARLWNRARRRVWEHKALIYWQTTEDIWKQETK